MKTLDRYIASKILSQFITVMFVLIALFVFIDMVSEMGEMNKTGSTFYLEYRESFTSYFQWGR